MSMQDWTEPGLGMPLYSDDNGKAILDFIIANAGCLPLLDPELLKDCEDAEDVYDKTDTYPSCLIADIINAKEGTSIFRGYIPDGDTDQEEMLGAEPCYPWQFNEKDRKLTEEDIREILLRYAKEFGNTIEPGYFNAEYCG